MAIKKIQIIPEGTNDYGDVLHPETSVDMVVDLERHGIASGTNTYTVSIPNTPKLITGLKISVKFTNANTGTSSLNLNGLGAKSIIKPGGGRPNIKAGGVYILVYDGVNFQLQGEGGEYGNVTPSDVIKGVEFGTEEGIKEGTLELTGTALTSDVLSGKSFYTTNPKSKQTGAMTNRGAVSKTITTQGGSYTIPAGYHNGSGIVKAQFANLTPENVRDKVNIGNVVGTFRGNVKIKQGEFRRDISAGFIVTEKVVCSGSIVAISAITTYSGTSTKTRFYNAGDTNSIFSSGATKPRSDGSYVEIYDVQKETDTTALIKIVARNSSYPEWKPSPTVQYAILYV